MVDLWSEQTFFISLFLPWSGRGFTEISWLFIGCCHAVACLNGHAGRSLLEGFVSLGRDLPSVSLHLCLSLCDSSALPSVWHTYIYTHSALALLQTTIFLGIQHRANWAKDTLVIINDVNSFLWHLGCFSVLLMLSHTLKGIKSGLWSVLMHDAWISHLGLVRESGYCLYEQGRKEGRKEGAPVDVTSFPRVSLSGLSG